MKKIVILLFCILSGCSTAKRAEAPVFPESFDGKPVKKSTCVPYFGSVCFGDNNCFMDYRCE